MIDDKGRFTKLTRKRAQQLLLDLGVRNKFTLTSTPLLATFDQKLTLLDWAPATDIADPQRVRADNVKDEFWKRRVLVEFNVSDWRG